MSKNYKKLLNEIANLKSKIKLEDLREKIYYNLDSLKIDLYEAFLIGEFIENKRNELYR